MIPIPPEALIAVVAFVLFLAMGFSLMQAGSDERERARLRVWCDLWLAVGAYGLARAVFSALPPSFVRPPDRLGVVALLVGVGVAVYARVLNAELEMRERTPSHRPRVPGPWAQGAAAVSRAYRVCIVIAVVADTFGWAT